MRNLLVIGALIHQATAFLSSPSVGLAFQTRGLSRISAFGSGYDKSASAESTRKSFIEDVIQASLGLSVASVAVTTPQIASASGGATAGGAYLLSGT